MKSKLSIYTLAAGATLAVAALGLSTAARADNLTWSVGVSSPGVQFDVSNARPFYGQPVYAQPYYAPQIYTQPQVVYHQPQVVYQQPQVIYQQPQVIYQQPQFIYQQPRRHHAPQVVYVQPRPVYVQPRPVYAHPHHGHAQPQVVYGHPNTGHRNRAAVVVNGQRPVGTAWQRPGEEHGPYYPVTGAQGRVAGVGQSNDGGRNHH